MKDNTLNQNYLNNIISKISKEQTIKTVAVWNSDTIYYKGNKVKYQDRIFECIAFRLIKELDIYACQATMAIPPSQLPLEWRVIG